MKNTAVQKASRTLYINQNNEGNRQFQIGDPGRYLAPGLFQQMLEIIKEKNINPKYGFSFALENEKGEKSQITGFLSSAVGVHHLDEGNRNLGTFLTQTGYLAIAPMSLCVKPYLSEQCRWITIEESFAVTAGENYLIARGKKVHVSFAALSEKSKETLFCTQYKKQLKAA